MKVLVIDNYDSFTYNLVHLLQELGTEVTVRRNDKTTLEEVSHFDKIMLSPGPGIPDEAGMLKEIIATFGPEKSLFGVCLGHQAIGQAFGGKLVNLSIDVIGQSGVLIRVLHKRPHAPRGGVTGRLIASDGEVTQRTR